jgi:hypothetical protein
MSKNRKRIQKSILDFWVKERNDTDFYAPVDIATRAVVVGLVQRTPPELGKVVGEYWYNEYGCNVKFSDDFQKRLESGL